MSICGVHQPERPAPRPGSRRACTYDVYQRQSLPGRAGCPGRRGRASLSSPPTPSRPPRGAARRFAIDPRSLTPHRVVRRLHHRAGRCPSRTSASVRSGWVAAKSVDIAPPSEKPSIDRPLGADGVEHGTDVVHARLEVGQTLRGDPIREAGAALVEEDESPHRGEPPVERRELRVFPAGLERAHPAVDEDEVDRPVAERPGRRSSCRRFARRRPRARHRPRAVPPTAAGAAACAGSSRDGSCCSISRSSSRSEADGSIPSSSESFRRNVW